MADLPQQGGPANQSVPNGPGASSLPAKKEQISSDRPSLSEVGLRQDAVPGQGRPKQLTPRPNVGASEAGASDLLNLWGGGSAQAKPLQKQPYHAPAKVEKPESKPEIKKAPPEPEKPLEKQPAKPEKEKHEVSEPIEGELIQPVQEVSPQAVDLLSENESFSDRLKEFTAELNLKPKHVFYSFGCLVFLIVFIWGGIYGYKFIKNKWQTPEEPAQQSQQVQQPLTAEEGDTGVPSTAVAGQITVIPPEFIGETGISAAVAIGSDIRFFTQIVEYIVALRRMQNAYATDVNELLNKSTDRAARIQSHVAFLKKIVEEADSDAQRIKTAMDAIKEAYDQDKEKQGELDVSFFEELKALNPEPTQDVLDEFIKTSQSVVTLRSRYKALQKIKSYYGSSLPRFRNLIRDIEANEDALVSGIKVYDVKGSDLQLIIPLEGETVPGTEGLSESPAYPFIPVHPAELNVGKDFITQPGGGF